MYIRSFYGYCQIALHKSIINIYLTQKCLFLYSLNTGYYEFYSSVICIAVISVPVSNIWFVLFCCFSYFMDLNIFSIIYVRNIFSQTISDFNFMFSLPWKPFLPTLLKVSGNFTDCLSWRVLFKKHNSLLLKILHTFPFFPHWPRGLFVFFHIFLPVLSLQLL